MRGKVPLLTRRGKAIVRAAAAMRTICCEIPDACPDGDVL
jgi:hypothetical protein